MYVYFDKKGTLTTIIPHGETIRQGNDIHLTVCFDKNYDRFKSNMTVRAKMRGEDNWSVAYTFSNPHIITFKKLFDSEMTYDLQDNTQYVAYDIKLPYATSTNVYGKGKLIINVFSNIIGTKTTLRELDETPGLQDGDIGCLDTNGIITYYVYDSSGSTVAERWTQITDDFDPTTINFYQGLVDYYVEPTYGNEEPSTPDISDSEYDRLMQAIGSKVDIQNGIAKNIDITKGAYHDEQNFTDANVRVKDAVDENEPVSLKQLNALDTEHKGLLDKKVDKFTQEHPDVMVAYVQRGDNKQTDTVEPVSATNLIGYSSIVGRDSNGNFEASDPTKDLHVVNKQTLEREIGKLATKKDLEDYTPLTKFEELVKVVPTDIAINDNDELYLEHDGKEITGQTKKVKIANLDDTDKLPIMSDIANITVAETLQYETIRGAYPRQALPNVIVSNNMEINTKTGVIRTLINAASENAPDYGNIQPFAVWTLENYIYAYRANDNTKNIHEIRMRSARGNISDGDSYAVIYSSEYGVYEPFIIYDETQSKSNKNFTVYVYFSEETENKLLQNIKYVRVKISLSDDSKTITPTVLSSGIAISGENQLNDKGNVVQYSRPGFSVITRLADASYLMVLETNVNNSIGYPYVIQYCYSKDYINWTTPKTLFRAKDALINIPYVENCWNSRIAISYHTNMDYIGVQDSSIHNKMMHVMLSSISIKYGMSLESNMFGELFITDGRQYSIPENQEVSRYYTTVGTYNLWTGGWGSLYYKDETINILYGSNYTRIANTSFPTENTLFVKKAKLISNAYVPLKNTKGVYAVSDNGKENILLDYATGADGKNLSNSLAYRTSGGFLYAATAANLNPNTNPNLVATKKYVGNYVDAKMVNVYTFKGSVDTYNDLPTNANNGDVYDIKKAYESYPAGTNFAWTGEKWDALGGIIDLSNYVTQTSLTETLKDYATITYITQTLANYVTSTNLTNILASYVTTTTFNSHVNNKSNPHEVTKTQVGLGNVDNTSDKNKPVSTAQQTAINSTGHTLKIANGKIQLLDANGTMLSQVDLPEGGKIDTISVNGVNQPITNKNVNIVTPVIEILESED